MNLRTWRWDRIACCSIAAAGAVLILAGLPGEIAFFFVAMGFVAVLSLKSL